ncbi:Muskelin 1, intracellular mediator containing kelch motif [Haplosporangium sp. Z 767]|nr:Muskelin 1, intracellular mediator containing kelch motif [Haplosporangium sp. Z 767]
MMLHPGSNSRPLRPLHNNAHDTWRDGSDSGNSSDTSNYSQSSAEASSMAAAGKKQGDYLTALAIMRPCVLDYDVHSCSSYSASYLPENIKTNNPQDQSSRWSSGSNNQMQYIMIKLKTMAIAHTITFGKYHKVHVCNLKEFKVFGGLTTSNMTELLHTGLRNDHEPETFLLKHKTNAVVFPCQYIKIVPLMAWGANFNFSIWHVEVKGVPDPELVQETYFKYINFRETESVRLCLKHFRQRKLLDAFKALQERTHIRLEDPLLTKLHRELVIRGNFKRAEELMGEAAERGLFDEYIRNYDYKPIWKRLESNQRRQESGPRHRGGHQMCIDTQGGYVYLMGGWDGARDLADFWAYHIPSQTWSLISADTQLQGGPSARSCHKICYSPQHRTIFVLGKYVDPDNRSKVDLSPDFWRFDIDPALPSHGQWTKICGNTAVMNGPELIYDHQMCLDPTSQTLYVFGGKVVHLDKNVQHYSGLYSYNIPSGVWKLLRADGHPPPKQDGSTVLRSRIGHTMLYDEMMRSLVIFAGQMNKDYLSDLYVYDIVADRIIEVCKDYNKQGGPDAGFTQRATISSRRREIYVLSGLVKDRALGAETVKNSFWVFKLPGQDQMDAIRGVQCALTNAKASGSIGSLKSIMSHGRSLSEQFDLDDERADGSSRPSSSRRRVHDEGSLENQTTRSSRCGFSHAGGATPPESRSSTAVEGSVSVSDQGPARTVRARSSNVVRKTNQRPGRASSFPLASSSSFSSSSSSSSSSPQSIQPNIDPAIMSQVSNQGTAPNMREGATSGMMSSTGTKRFHPDVDRSTSHRSRHPSDPRPHLSVNAEPMSLAYVLSDQGSWQKVFQNSSAELGELGDSEPVPRYAHQLVYDDVNEVQYLFGGNPGEQGNMSKRLDDFWELRLYRPKPDEIVRKAKYLLRTQQFKELCQRSATSALTSTTFVAADTMDLAAPVKAVYESTQPRQSRTRPKDDHVPRPGLIQRGTLEHQEQSFRALRFLQTELSPVVDQTNKGESDDFKALIRGLLMGAFSPTTGIASTFSNGLSHRGLLPEATRTQNARTTVVLAPSPIASPSLHSANRLMFSPNLSLTSATGMRPFLASPDNRILDESMFDTMDNSAAVDMEEQDTEDMLMHDSFQSEQLAQSRTPRTRQGDPEIQILDQNGDRIVDAEGDQEDRKDDMLNQDMKKGMMIDENEFDGTDEEEGQDAIMKSLYRDRTLLYEKLLEFFSDEVKQPKNDLADLVKIT